MRDLRKFTASYGGSLAKRAAALELGRVRSWLPLAAILVIAGCSWFSEEPTPPPPDQTAQKTTPPEPGEGETMKNAEGQAGGTQTAQSGGQATYPDINSVPNEAPKPDTTSLEQAQQGLGSDTANAQHTEETLTMPNESAARPENPAPATGEQAASVQPTAPESAAAPPIVTPGAETPGAETPAPPAPEAATQPQPAPQPTPAPAVAPVPEVTPPPAPAPESEQVALVGTPQAGAMPFEPSGPLHLAPGSLARNPQEAAVATAPTTPPPTNLASSGISTTPLPSAAPMTGGSGVSVDYSVLNGLQAGAPASYQPAMSMAPVSAPVATSVAGVGQAVGYVFFGNGSSVLSPADREVLRQVAALQRVQGGVLRIVGHASQRTGNLDPVAQDQVNERVSLARATAVARALVDMGVQPALVQVAAAGDNQTLYAESTPAGEAGNRRAEVYLSAN
ncbi:MAG TPA: OmpA family protein [Candidatus Cybelea sp.]|nr:OmpA family protein [Candidatus Cybelea sp.]